MTSATGSRARSGPRASGEATRRRLLDNARLVFARDGYSGAPTQEIVEASEVAPTALYHHFGSKLGLFVAAGREVYETFLGYLAEAVDDETGFAAALRSMVAAAAELHCADPTLAPMAITVQLEVRRDPQIRAELAHAVADFQQLAERVAQLAPDRMLEQHGLRALTLTVVALLNGLSTLGATLRDPADFAAVAQCLLDLLPTDER